MTSTAQVTRETIFSAPLEGALHAMWKENTKIPSFESNQISSDYLYQ